jgi:hypothetical protein
VKILDPADTDAPAASPFDPDPDAFTVYDVAKYTDQADQYINGRIAAIFSTPLRKVNFGGRLVYPAPIPSISARLTAKFLWSKPLAGGQRATSEFVDKNYKEATLELDEVARGNVRLNGQDGQLGSRFARAGWFNIPPSPTKNEPKESR